MTFVPHEKYSAEFVEWARAVKTSKRAQKALEFLLEQGSVTTGELQEAGYDHPPRAVRDLKDAGFAIEAANVRVDGRRMAQYTLLDSTSADFAQRRPIPNAFRNLLFEAHGHRCAACGQVFITRMLQADHRVPFHIGGDPVEFTVPDFMPLCGPDNRAKSMSCENCVNWAQRDPDMCRTCYWHDPEHYEHVAGEPERRVTIVAREEGDVRALDRARADAEAEGLPLAQHILKRLE